MSHILSNCNFQNYVVNLYTSVRNSKRWFRAKGCQLGEYYRGQNKQLLFISHPFPTSNNIAINIHMKDVIKEENIHLLMVLFCCEVVALEMYLYSFSLQICRITSV